MRLVVVITRTIDIGMNFSNESILCSYDWKVEYQARRKTSDVSQTTKLGIPGDTLPLRTLLAEQAPWQSLHRREARTSGL